MGNITVIGEESNLNFETISDFKWCMKCGGEVEFIWKDKTYNIVHDSDGIVIYEAFKCETEKNIKLPTSCLNILWETSGCGRSLHR